MTRMNIHAINWEAVPNARSGDDVASYLQREGAPGAAALQKAFAEAPLIGYRDIDEVPKTEAQKLREMFQ